jgi:hypothetical protein
VKSYTDPDFWQLYSRLPKAVQLQAKIAYQRWKADPYHPGLSFKCISKNQSVYSVRIGRRWRALGLREDNAVTWFWIGSHEAYNELIKRF